MEKPNTGTPQRSGQGMPQDQRKEDESGKQSQHGGGQDWQRDKGGSKSGGSGSSTERPGGTQSGQAGQSGQSGQSGSGQSNR